MDKMEELNQQMTMRNNSFERDMTTHDWFIFGQYFGVHCEGKSSLDITDLFQNI